MHAKQERRSFVYRPINAQIGPRILPQEGGETP
jgi:hypothetical protein